MRSFFCSLLFLCALCTPAHAEEYTLTLKNHMFTPSELTIPANTRVQLTVKNEDAATAEFESHDLNREKVVQGNSSIVVMIGPLDPGTYNYVDEFHEETAHGTIIVK